MSDIFISYAREDLERTKQLAKVLSSLGWKVFFDRRIPAGKTWAEYIGKELDDAKGVIVVWSKASLASRFVKLEANNALAKGKLIPLLIEDVTPPFEFGDLNAADLSRWDGDKNSEEFSNLVMDIENLIGSRPKVETVSDKSEEAEVEEEKRLKEAAETKRKAEEEKRLKEEAEIQRKVEEEKRLKEEAETQRKVEEEKRLKEAAEARRKVEEKKRKLKEHTEKVKIDKEVVSGLEKTTLISILKKIKFKIALIFAGIIAVTVIIILVVNGGKEDNNDLKIREQRLENPNETSAEMQFWNNVLTNDKTVAGFKSYQIKYPNGIYFNEAQKKIDEIEDTQDWETALLADTIAAYREYEQMHPTGKHLMDAKQKIIDIENQQQLDTQEKERNQLVSDEKARKNEDTAWNTAKSTNTIASYQAYLQRYPNNLHTSEARNKIDGIQRLSNIEVKITFQNISNETFEVFWDNSGTEKKYDDLGPGQSYVMTTHVNHLWKFRQRGVIIDTYSVKQGDQIIKIGKSSTFINGLNVMSVRCDNSSTNPQGYIQNIGGKNWRMRQPNNTFFDLTEFARDEWSVYMQRNGDNFHVQIDIYQKSLYHWTDDINKKSKWFTIWGYYLNANFTNDN